MARKIRDDITSLGLVKRLTKKPGASGPRKIRDDITGPGLAKRLTKRADK